MKTRFRASVLILLLLLFALPMVAFAQDGEETETVPTEAVVVEVIDVAPLEEAAPEEAPVLVLDDEPWYVVMTVWGGWLTAALFGGLTFYFAKDSAAKGNKLAELGLNFFEASKDMIPFDKYQYQFEQMARRTANPIDNIVAAATSAIGNELGLLNHDKEQLTSDIPPHEAQSR
jgi:hypothetical protein